MIEIIGFIAICITAVVFSFIAIIKASNQTKILRKRDEKDK